MDGKLLLSARVDPYIKQRFVEVARQQGISESALLKKAIDGVLVGAGAPLTDVGPVGPVAKSCKLSVRLRPDDLVLIRERATARSIPTATYVSLLIRGHLRNLAPLPDAELAALRQSVNEIGAIGRNLNQVARALNQGHFSTGVTRADLQAILRALGALRDHVKGLISANLSSWEVGYAETLG
jgi:hypothetical protein